MNNEQKEQMIKTNAFDGISFDPEKRLLIARSLIMSKCKCGGTLKSIYYPIAPTPMSGYKCILFCTKSKIEVIGGGILCTKRDAYKLAKEKLEERENKEFNE